MEKKLNVMLLRHTANPEKLIASAAKLCYSASNFNDLIETVEKQGEEKAREFIDKLVAMEHESPLEHVVYTFGIEGISRVLSHQFVRHRLASYSQQSQRYVSEHSKKNDGVFDYIIPPLFKKVEKEEWFKEKMRIIQSWYDESIDFFRDAGYVGEKANEDARYVLPNAAETKIIVTRNARELMNFFKRRTCNRAQGEIVNLAKEMYKLVYPTAPTVFKYAGPNCVTDVCHEGKMSCGLADKVKEEFEKIKESAK